MNYFAFLINILLFTLAVLCEFTSASLLHQVQEAYLKKQVYDLAQSICWDAHHSKIEPLKEGYKAVVGRAKDRRNGLSNVEKYMLSQEEATFVATEACKLGRFDRFTLQELLGKIRNIEPQLDYEYKGETRTDLILEGEANTDQSTSIPDERSSPATLKELLPVFCIGLLVGFGVAHYVILLRGGDKVQIPPKLRRPEL